MINWVHPSIFLIPGSLLIPFLKGRAKQAYLILLPSLALVDILWMSPGLNGIYHFLEYDLVLGRVDSLSLVFATIFSIIGLVGMIYALHVKEDGQHIAAMFYVGSSLGVVFAGDLFTLFIFWEIMAVSSVFLIWYRRGKAAMGAGFRYILVHTFGGVCLLGGIVLYVVETGSIQFGLIENGGLGFYLILIGFILNAAVPPLHAWLADAYPEATVTGAVFLSAFTTKTAVYTLIRGFPGTEILIWLGAIMAIYGVVYAVLANDIRRLLAYHIISQVGYMVAGVGMGTVLALNGASAHAFSHILYKSLLFMGAGAVIQMTGRGKLTELGGLYRTMPLTFVLYMIGGFSISAFPLFSGFVSKSMVVSAAAEDHRAAIWLMLTLASSGTFLHTGLKLPYFTFLGKDAGIKAKEPPLNMLVAMGIAAFFCILIGVYPQILYGMLPFPVEYTPYTAAHVVWSLELLLFTGVAFFMLLKLVGGKQTISLDTDWFYRKGSKVLMWFAEHPVVAFENFVGRLYQSMVIRWNLKLARIGFAFDITVIDGMVNGVARMILAWAASMRRIQSGQIQHYALMMFLGLFVILSMYLLL